MEQPLRFLSQVLKNKGKRIIIIFKQGASTDMDSRPVHELM